MGQKVAEAYNKIMQVAPSSSPSVPLPTASEETHNNSSDSQQSGGRKSTAAAAQEQRTVQKLQAVDMQVRAHEAAHLAAGGGVVTGGANFSYTRGPDGRMYATGGEVPIDSGKESTPDKTIAKAQRIRVAAMAPADPSPQDYRVAAMAIIMEQQARLEKMQELQSQLQGRSAYAGEALGTERSAAGAEG
jgi:hypothetical protein